MMREANKRDCDGRLKRIEGQVRGIARMIEGDRYCSDVLIQLRAVRAALKRVEDEVLKDHVATCVEHAIQSGDAEDQRNKITELLTVLDHRQS
jgi:DNA-binding FrmR family transcriptional regulator